MDMDVPSESAASAPRTTGFVGLDRLLGGGLAAGHTYGFLDTFGYPSQALFETIADHWIERGAQVLFVGAPSIAQVLERRMKPADRRAERYQNVAGTVVQLDPEVLGWRGLLERLPRLLNDADLVLVDEPMWIPARDEEPVIRDLAGLAERHNRAMLICSSGEFLVSGTPGWVCRDGQQAARFQAIRKGVGTTLVSEDSPLEHEAFWLALARGAEEARIRFELLPGLRVAQV
ncbi:hypothetical protein WI372_17245 [Gemmatimonadota bacterium DH-20]|uniref:Uncharacterized protein n=1 Tax=Gaopeijia maritima TaxID=3119007 RepID=A0ABU9EGY1_9BACT